MESIPDLSHEELLHLISLREVLGGFAHEIAQPLNAVMIASQVIMLKLQQSQLPQDDKDYVNQRLDLVARQVRRATDIIGELRSFSQGKSDYRGVTDLKGIFEKVQGLMGQQLSNRGIELEWEAHEPLPAISRDFSVIEAAMIHALAYARDQVQAIGDWHDRKAVPYKKGLTAKLMDVDGHSIFQVSWDPGRMTEEDPSVSPRPHCGLTVLNAVLNPGKGAIETAFGSVKVSF